MASQIKLKRSSVPGNSPTFGTEIVEGELALNTADQKLYSANSTATFTLASSTPGGGGSVPINDIFYENSANVTTSYTISTNKNALSAGPITIDSGVTVTIPSNSEWTIV